MAKDFSVRNQELFERGYTIVPLEDAGPLQRLQSFLFDRARMSLIDLHLKDLNQEEHIHLVKSLTDALIEAEIVQDLAFRNLNLFTELLGPDIDIQRKPHLRVSRPNRPNDLISWHRDTFYGNSPWELNMWLPVFELHAGAGLCILPGSHRAPAKNIRVIEDANEFRRSVSKGSDANQIGYVYMPKTDDVIEGMKSTDSIVLMPKLGEAVLFMGCGVHSAQNNSSETRVTVDFRIKNHFSPTGTASDYYQPLARGPLQRAALEYLDGRENWAVQ